MSPEFIKRLRELRQARLRTQEFQKWQAANPNTPAGMGKWTAAPWTGQTAQTIVYDPLTGKAFPNPSAAISAGIKNFSYQIPSGMNVDWSYWDQFSQPATPTRPVQRTVQVADQTVSHPLFSSTASNTASNTGSSSTDNADSKPTFNMPDEARRFADAGMFGRASAAVKAAGGTWSSDMHRQLKKDAGSNKNFGGDFKNQGTIDGILANTDLLATATSGPGGKISYKVPMGKAKKAYEKIHGKGSFTKETHVAIAAAQKRKEKADRDSRNR